MWDHCNGILHNSSQPREDILDSVVNDHIHTLYIQGLQAIPCNAFHFFSSLEEELLAQPRHYKVQWVASVEAAKIRKQYHDHGNYLSEQ